MSRDDPAVDTRPVVFVGPTLAEAGDGWGSAVRVLPPARLGDILAAVEAGATTIGLIDGIFELGPSVWHKEILLALESGVTVAGGASLGALRAAELQSFGMHGVGSIFRRYLSGEVDRDDAVMIQHAPAQFGWQPFTLSLFDMVDTLDFAHARLGTDLHRQLTEAAKCLHFSERTWEKLVERAALPEDRRSEVCELLTRSRWRTKQEDALALLAALPSLAHMPRGQRQAVPRTVFLRHMLREFSRFPDPPAATPRGQGIVPPPAETAGVPQATPECHDPAPAHFPAR